MTLRKVSEKVFFKRNEPNEIKILLYYRYLSLLGTSLFYFFGDSNHSIENKIFVILCLTISSIILSYLYICNQNSSKIIAVLVLIETISNALILIPSGGLNSPFVWYALNTILVTSVKLKPKYCWINLSIYLFVSIANQYLFLDKGEVNLVEIIGKEANLILCFILITAAMLLLIKFTKRIQNESEKLIETNKQLLSANKKIKESMEHIMALYQTVHSFSNQRNRNDLIKLLIHYTKEITKSDIAFFSSIPIEENEIVFEGNDYISDILKEKIRDEILKNSNCIINNVKVITVNVENKEFAIVAVVSTYKNYGVLGIEITGCGEDIILKENLDELQFLAELSSIALERFYLEEINERLLINNEQNRIADEIHDSVQQRLFSMSCCIFALMKNLEDMTIEQMREELDIIRDSADKAIKELRTVIYGLSSKKYGVNTFEADITDYINEIKRMNNIEILFNIIGNHEILSAVHKKALYRIICEGIGNALRHGKADYIDITIEIKFQFSLLKITDNGIGFNSNKIKSNKQMGLGIRNIYNLSHSLNGELKIESKKGKGTNIEVTIPNIIKSFKEEEVV